MRPTPFATKKPEAAFETVYGPPTSAVPRPFDVVRANTSDTYWSGVGGTGSVGVGVGAFVVVVVGAGALVVVVVGAGAFVVGGVLVVPMTSEPEASWPVA